MVFNRTLVNKMRNVMRRVQILIFIFIINLINPTFAQYNSIRGSEILIKGVVLDSIANNIKDSSIIVRLCVTSFASKVNVAPTVIYNVKTSPGKEFEFKFKAPDDYFYINIMLNIPNQFTYWNNPDNMYIVEVGDNLFCELSSQDYKFYGKGSDKLNCQSEIYHKRYLANDDYTTLLQKGKYEEAFRYRSKIKDSLLKSSLEVVESYSDRLDPSLVETFKANCYGNIYASDIRGERGSGNNLDRLNAFLGSRDFNIDLSL